MSFAASRDQIHQRKPLDMGGRECAVGRININMIECLFGLDVRRVMSNSHEHFVVA